MQLQANLGDFLIKPSEFALLSPDHSSKNINPNPGMIEIKTNLKITRTTGGSLGYSSNNLSFN
jgi:hypothetical protein